MKIIQKEECALGKMSGQSPRCIWYRIELLIAGRDDIVKGILLLPILALLVRRLLGSDTELFAENETELQKNSG